MANKPSYSSLSANAAILASTLNANFEALALAIRDCMGRGGVTESPNSMFGNLDMDGYRILNCGGINIEGIDLTNLVQAVTDAETAATAAEASATSASGFADDAEDSAVASAASAQDALDAANAASAIQGIPSVLGNSLKFLRVKEDESGIEWSDALAQITTVTPTLTGDSSGDEGATIVITVSNWDSDATYTETVSGGTATDNLDGTYDWELPLVTADTDHTFSVYAVKTGELQSATATKTVTVLDVPVVAGTTITFANSTSGFPDGDFA